MDRIAHQRQHGAAGTAADAPASPARVDIRPAAPDDMPAIAAIANQWRPGERPDTDLTSRGFLVSDYALEDYRQLLTNADHFLVARQGDQVVGFLIAYRDRSLERVDDTTAEWLSARLSDFVVIKQVAVDPQFLGQGIGRHLYLSLIDVLHGSGTRLAAAVVNTPPNHRSRRFHEALGFAEAFSLQHADGKERSIWIYRTGQASDGVLAAQYHAAVSLYIHEDNLNWDKLRNYLYITVATATAVGFVVAQDPAPASSYSPVAIGLVLCAIGLLTSIGFAVALRSGVSYLSIRKEATTDLEDLYVGRDGTRVVSRFYRSRPWLRRSPTTWVLTYTPVAGGVLWLTSLLYLFSVLDA